MKGVANSIVKGNRGRLLKERNFAFPNTMGDWVYTGCV
jgi:hypothetical protein